MKNYIIYVVTGKILRRGLCVNLDKQVSADGFVMEGVANDVTQKVKFDGLDDSGQPVNPRIVNKTLEEIKVDNPTPPEIPEEKRAARITNEQWYNVLKRLKKFEAKK